MNHQHHSDEMSELAMLYALAVLPPEQAAAFEAHLAAGCRTCETTIDDCAAVVGRLGYAAPPVSPRPEVRSRLLSRIRGDARSRPPHYPWTIIRAMEGDWETGSVAGVVYKPLFRDREAQRLTALVRMEGGVRYPAHRHEDTEELYLLEGDLTVEGQRLQAGDFCAALAGTIHGETASESGCTFLLLASERDAIVEGGKAGTRQSGLRFVHSAQLAWREGGAEGVMIRPLYTDPARQTLTALVRMQAGSRLQRHRHVTHEQFYMLEGDGHVADHTLGPGDYYHIAAGSVHEVTYSEGGCMFLLIASRAEFLE